MGDPAPTAARQVLDQGETREFVIDGIDWDREGLDLALAGFESEEAKAAPHAEGPAPTSGGEAPPALRSSSQGRIAVQH